MVAYLSTRGGAGVRGFEDVLLAGLAEDGGLFVPLGWPRLSRTDLDALKGASYAETAFVVLGPWMAEALGPDAFERMLREAYAGFGHPAVAPLRQIGDDDWLLELFHGPTLAFKDFALQLLGRVFEAVLARRRERITIVGATSGDTGSAAIAACAGRQNMRIAILHPHERVSEVQRRQMTTVSSPNVANIAIRGTFDDCQALVKAMFNDHAFRAEQKLAAINSINWARIVAQAVYYVWAALRLGGLDRPLSFTVPTGNFGDVYAGYVAHKMGLPLRRLVVATNRNDILARFLDTGVYRIGRVEPTISPSMDIQVASNFERLLFDLEGREPERLRERMAELARDGRIEVTSAQLAEARRLFSAAAIDEETTRLTMRTVLESTGELVDPHTAVGIAACRRFGDGRDAARIVLATAHPAKFPDALHAATGRRPVLPAHLAGLYEREERYAILPNDLQAVQNHLRERAWAR